MTGLLEGHGDVIGGDDCDDSDDTVYTGSVELCDGVDNDCSRDGTSSGVPATEIDDVCGLVRHRMIRKRRRQDIIDVVKSLFACFDTFAPYCSVDTAMPTSLAV